MKTNSLLYILILTATSTCYTLPPCTEYRKRFFDKEVYAVVTDKGLQGNSFHIKGVEPTTSIKVDYADVDGLYNFIWNSLEIGDTIIKSKGTDRFLLKKKSLNIAIQYNCEGGMFGNIRPDTLKK
jgi:hypothetical protein